MMTTSSSEFVCGQKHYKWFRMLRFMSFISIISWTHKGHWIDCGISGDVCTSHFNSIIVVFDSATYQSASEMLNLFSDFNRNSGLLEWETLKNKISDISRLQMGLKRSKTRLRPNIPNAINLILSFNEVLVNLYKLNILNIYLKMQTFSD